MMGEFFTGWRRLVGIVLLVPSFLAMVEWIEVHLGRSLGDIRIEDSSILEPAVATITLTALSTCLILFPRKWRRKAADP